MSHEQMMRAFLLVAVLYLLSAATRLG